jgi:FlaG/FlaF family flagellin (archaellin)
MRPVGRLRGDGRCVSPIIAEVLMVTISVMLAAIIYVMVSGTMQATPRQKNIAVICARVAPSPNYKCVIASADANVDFNLVSILVMDQNGTVLAYLPTGIKYTSGAVALQNIQPPLATGTKVTDNGDNVFGLNDDIYLIPVAGRHLDNLVVKISGGGANGSTVLQD